MACIYLPRSRCVYYLFSFLRLALRFTPIHVVGQAETWGASETFRRRSEIDTVAELEDLMNQVFARRAGAVVIPYVYFIFYSF